MILPGRWSIAPSKNAWPNPVSRQGLFIGVFAYSVPNRSRHSETQLQSASCVPGEGTSVPLQRKSLIVKQVAETKKAPPKLVIGEVESVQRRGILTKNRTDGQGEKHGEG